MKKGAFLDVDGVIRHNDRSIEGGNFYNLIIDDVMWIHGAVDAMFKLYTMGYDVYWITMQNCIAEGLITSNECNKIFEYMRNHVNSLFNANIVKDYYICVTSEDKEAKIEAKTNAVYEASLHYDIDLESSFGCGDAEADIIAFKRAGIGVVCHIDLPDNNTTKNDHNVKLADGISPSLETAVHWLSCRGYDPNSMFIHKENKLTGYEYWITNNDVDNQCYKLLHLFKGRKSSLHSHKIKSEKFKVIQGIVLFTYCDEQGNTASMKLFTGDEYNVKVNLAHSFEALSDTAILLEESLYHVESDTYRITNSCGTCL